MDGGGTLTNTTIDFKIIVQDVEYDGTKYGPQNQFLPGVAQKSVSMEQFPYLSHEQTDIESQDDDEDDYWIFSLILTDSLNHTMNSKAR